MPLIGSSAYNTAGSILTLIRSLLNDAAGNWASDSVLLPYLNSSYRRVQRKLANNGVNLFITDNVLLVVPAVPANEQDPETQVVINDATPAPNQLPANLLVPLKLWERPNLSTQDFVEMIDMSSKGGLPSRLQGFTLDEWEWRTDGIYFVGATQDTQLRMRYYAALQDLTGAGDYVLIRNAQEAIAFGAAALASAPRGSAIAQNYSDEQDAADEDVIAFYTRMQQRGGTRRRPFSSRGGSLSYGRRVW